MRQSRELELLSCQLEVLAGDLRMPMLSVREDYPRIGFCGNSREPCKA